MDTAHAYGNGSIYRRSADGRWYGALDIGSLDGRRRRVTVSGRHRIETEVRLARLRRRLAAASPELGVGEFLHRWLTDILPGTVGSPNTYDNYAWAIESHLVPGLGRIALVDLEPGDVARFLHAKLASGLGVRSVARLRTVLGAALAHAVIAGLLSRNVARLTRSPRGPTRPGRALSLPQARALLEAARGSRFEAAVVLMVMLGLRPGETLGLRWSDVDLDASLVRITHTLGRGRHGHHLGPTKTPQSRRCLVLPGPVVAALRDRAVAQHAERAKAKARWVEHDFVFTTRHGGAVDHATLGEHLGLVCEAAGLDYWHAHSLRHSAVSLLSAAGLRLEDVADVMGHRSTRTTSAVYRHTVVSAIDAAVDPVEQLFGGPSDSPSEESPAENGLRNGLQHSLHARHCRLADERKPLPHKGFSVGRRGLEPLTPCAS